MDKLKRVFNNFTAIRYYIGVHKISAIAAATAFWFFLAIVPMVILAVSILPYTALTQEQVLAFLAPALPRSLNLLIASIIADVYENNLTALSVSLAVAVWSASRGFASLLRGLEEIYRQEVRSGFFQRMLLGAVYTLSILLFLTVFMALGGLGRQILRLAEQYVPSLHAVAVWLLQFRFLVVIAMLTLLFMVVFRWGTGQLLRPRETFWGALLAAAGWSVLTLGFSVWVDRGGYGAYGSLATVTVVMLWLYLCQYAVLLGACFNRAIPRAVPKIKGTRQYESYRDLVESKKKKKQ